MTTVEARLVEYGHPCRVPGCSQPRYRFDPFCSRHCEARRLNGHPILKAPRAPVRLRTIRATEAALKPFMASQDLTAWLDVLQSTLSSWAAKLHREHDRQLVSRLADVDSKEFLAACTAWALNESKRDAFVDPIPFWLAECPRRQQQFLGLQLAKFLAHTIKGSASGSSQRQRAMGRICRMILFYRIGDTTMLKVATDLARRVGANVKNQLTKALNARRERDDALRERRRLREFPFGINADGTWDLYRSPGLQGA